MADELLPAVRELIASGRQLGRRTEQVLDRDTERAAEMADLRARISALERGRPSLERVFALAQRSVAIQRGAATALVLLALVGAYLVAPGLFPFLPLLGGLHAP